MAGHGGGGGGHGGGGGGGASKGRLSGIMGNGCLRYLFLYIIGLVLILGFLGASALGLFRRLPIPLPSLPVASAGSTIASAPTAAAAAAAAAPATAAPAAVAAAAAPAAGQAAGTGSTASQSTGGGNTTTAPGMAQLQSVPLMGAQGVNIIPYIVPAFYVVQPSDTLPIIAATYGTTAAAIHSYNGLTSDDLKVGQILYLPPPAYNPVPGTGRNAHP